MRIIIIVLTTICLTIEANACCSAGQFRIFPVGEVNGEIVAIEMRLGRRCNREGDEGAGLKNQFIWNSLINLCYLKGDTTEIIQNIDTVRFIECQCTYSNLDSLSQYREKLYPYYLKGLDIAKKLPGFTLGNPLKIEYIKADSLAPVQFVNDSSFTYSGNSKVHNMPFFWAASCGMLHTVREIKHYEIGTKKVIVINLSCRNRMKNETAMEQNKMYFQNIETAFYKDIVTWHGYSQDFFFIE